MANLKLNVPNPIGLVGESVPHGVGVYLQATKEALDTIDRNTIYKDSISINVPNPTIFAKTAHGQAFSVSGTSLASGDDFAAAVLDIQRILNDLLTLRAVVVELIQQLKGN